MAELADMAATSAVSEAVVADASAMSAETEAGAGLAAEADPRTMAAKREPNDGALAGSICENAVTSLFFEIAEMSEPMERGVHEADPGGICGLGNPGSSAIVLLGGASVSQAARLPDFGV